MGIGAGIDDTVKSFLKRQLGIAPGSRWVGFDQGGLRALDGSSACASATYPHIHRNPQHDISTACGARTRMAL